MERLTLKEFMTTPIVDLIGARGRIVVVIMAAAIFIACIFIMGMAASRLLAR